MAKDISNFNEEWFYGKTRTYGLITLMNRPIIDDHDAIINVSDVYDPALHAFMTENSKGYWWFPMNEVKRDIGVNSIYGAMFILATCELKNISTVIHCMAGAKRSPIIRECYKFVRSGEWDDTGVYHDIIKPTCDSGFLPSISELERFLEKTSVVVEDYINITITEFSKNIESQEYWDLIAHLAGKLDEIKLDVFYNY